MDLAIVMRISGGGIHTKTGREKVLFRELLRWIEAAKGTQQSLSAPISLTLLSEGCTLHKIACQTLKKYHRPDVIRPIASGVRGLPESVTAGLGIGCLNLSAIHPTEMFSPTALALPELPDAEFVLYSRDFSDAIKLRTCASFSQILVHMLDQVSGRMSCDEYPLRKNVDA